MDSASFDLPEVKRILEAALLSSSEPLGEATGLAMRDAGAKLAAEFKDAAIARGLLPAGGTTAPAEVTPLLP